MITVWEKAQSTQKPVLIYGTGNGADKIIDEATKSKKGKIGFQEV